MFGPSALAARMEGSKAFSKDFMARHSIPTAKYRIFASSEVDQAISYVQTCGHKVVLKASGLAGGKGVLIPETTEEAVEGLKEIMVANVFGAAGPQIRSCNLHKYSIRSILFQAAKSLWKSSSLVPKCPSWRSQMDTPSCLSLLRKTTNVLARVMLD